MSRRILRAPGAEHPVAIDAQPDAGVSGGFIVRVAEPRREVRTYHVKAERAPDGALIIDWPDGRRTRAVVSREGAERWVTHGARTARVVEARLDRRGASGAGSLEAPMPGTVLEVLVRVGDAVEAGQPLLIVEAMKMEHRLRAPRDGVVAGVAAQVGDKVNPGTPLVVVHDAASGRADEPTLDAGRDGDPDEGP